MKQDQLGALSIGCDVVEIGPQDFNLDAIVNFAIETETVRKGNALLIAGLLALVGGLFFLTSPSWLEAVFVGAIGIVAYRAWLESSAPKYHLILETGSARVRAYSSRSKEQVLGLRDALEEAGGAPLEKEALS
ncbi:DUF6232 family protein [Sphingomicrobium clamense]|uniref:Uncharacterized protein n=1 Tax=Sphingomicrobium clamense TaxID=2851013 RepID=A0ABS6V2M6_9SPHN|nr:DUF6232 family protein [Sphingomicrobium sp. B8]MBW0143784.1 hypothetical protein [Sphingomicrobium sp. B8]